MIYTYVLIMFDMFDGTLQSFVPGDEVKEQAVGLDALTKLCYT